MVVVGVKLIFPYCPCVCLFVSLLSLAVRRRCREDILTTPASVRDNRWRYYAKSTDCFMIVCVFLWEFLCWLPSCPFAPTIPQQKIMWLRVCAAFVCVCVFEGKRQRTNCGLMENKQQRGTHTHTFMHILDTSTHAQTRTHTKPKGLPSPHVLPVPVENKSTADWRKHTHTHTQ